MEIDESFFWKNHGKLAHLQILAPKIFHEIGYISMLLKNSLMGGYNDVNDKYCILM